MLDLDLDRRFDQAAGELRHRLATAADPRTAATVVRRARRRRRTGLAAVAVTAVLGMLAVLTSGVGRRSGVVGASPRAAVDRLLYPSRVGGKDAAVDEVLFGPASGFGPRVVLLAPNGAVFVVAVSPRFGTELTPGAQRQEVRGRTYAVEASRGSLYYTSADDCDVVGVQQSSPSAAPFDRDATELLGGLEVVGGQLTVTLPAGWASTDVGEPGNLVQVAFASAALPGIGFSLAQLPDTSVAALVGGFAMNGPLRADTLADGRPAWSATPRAENGGPVAPSDTAFTAIAWQNGPDAAVLYSASATLDELKRVVETLEPGHANAFAGYTPTVDRSTEATTPTTLPPPEARDASQGAACGTPELTVAG